MRTIEIKLALIHALWLAVFGFWWLDSPVIFSKGSATTWESPWRHKWHLWCSRWCFLRHFQKISWQIFPKKWLENLFGPFPQQTGTKLHLTRWAGVCRRGDQRWGWGPAKLEKFQNQELLYFNSILDSFDQRVMAHVVPCDHTGVSPIGSRLYSKKQYSCSKLLQLVICRLQRNIMITPGKHRKQ